MRKQHWQMIGIAVLALCLLSVVFWVLSSVLSVILRVVIIAAAVCGVAYFLRKLLLKQ